MLQVELPISKSIANRLLILQALHGDPLMEVSVATPRDVALMRSLLQVLLERESLCRQHLNTNVITIDVENCGTAARFLTAYASLRDVGEVVITGSERMRQRPMRQLVETLCLLGADISYIEKEGFLPLKVTCRDVQARTAQISQPHSTQFVSALMLMGIETYTDESSPYIELTRWCIDNYETIKNRAVEADWSAAAFWYEWVALHAPNQKLLLKGLSACSMQGDKAIADVFSRLGVTTQFYDYGVVLSYTGDKENSIRIDFRNIPDAYPAVAFTCHLLGVELEAIGLDRLKWKESDREKAVNSMKEGKPLSYDDHRIAMSLMAADMQTDNDECVVKSYPLFVRQKEEVESDSLPSLSVVVARRGINDEGRGKKYALHKLIKEVETEYVWLQDDDIVQPKATLLQMRRKIAFYKYPDLLILPLRMTNGTGKILEEMQKAEYAAIQQLTICTAQKGRAVMCSGANMIVNRERWLECYGELHPELPSGDDMFLLEAFKRRQYKINVCTDIVCVAEIKPISSCKDFFKQRMRWAGKANRYTDRDIITAGAVIVCANLLQILCPPVLLFKFPVEYKLIRKRETSVSLFAILLLEVVYPFYMLVCLICGLWSSRHNQPQF